MPPVKLCQDREEDEEEGAAADAGFANAVLSTPADVVATIGAPDTVNIGLPPAPAPGSPDDRESTARLLRLLRDRDAPAEEKTRAYQDALRAMLTPDVRGHRARDRGGSASPRR